MSETIEKYSDTEIKINTTNDKIQICTIEFLLKEKETFELYLAEVNNKIAKAKELGIEIKVERN